MDGSNEPPIRGVAIGAVRENTYNPFNDPYFLHSSDHPGMILVSATLVGTNYLTWSRSMKIILGAKHKFGFIDGRVQPEEGT